MAPTWHQKWHRKWHKMWHQKERTRNVLPKTKDTKCPSQTKDIKCPSQNEGHGLAEGHPKKSVDVLPQGHVLRFGKDILCPSFWEGQKMSFVLGRTFLVLVKDDTCSCHLWYHFWWHCGAILVPSSGLIAGGNTPEGATHALLSTCLHPKRCEEITRTRFRATYVKVLKVIAK